MSKKSEEQQGILARWSQRKLDKTAENAEQAIEVFHQDNSEDELEDKDKDQQDLPIWQQDNVDDKTKTSALVALFRQPEFQEVDHMNEYDEDFTRFNPLGNVIPREMKRMLKLAEQRTRPDEQLAVNNDDLEQQDKDEQSA